MSLSRRSVEYALMGKKWLNSQYQCKCKTLYNPHRRRTAYRLPFGRAVTFHTEGSSSVKRRKEDRALMRANDARRYLGEKSAARETWSAAPTGLTWELACITVLAVAFLAAVA